MRTLTMTIDLTDEEFSNFVANIGRKAIAPTTDDDEGPAVTAAGVLDKNGVPWLEGIHSSAKTQTKEGLWRTAKGVKPEQRAAAEAAWKQNAAAGQTFTVPASILPSAGGPVAIPTAAPFPAPPVAPMPFPAPALAAPPAPFPAPPARVVTLEEVVSKYNALAGAGRLTNDQFGAIYQRTGVTDPQMLMNDETKRRGVMEYLEYVEKYDQLPA